MEHKVNEWGIEVVEESGKGHKGLGNVKVDEQESVEDLLKELNDM